ncbi:hypothetical protein COV04_02135 [Candidatus Uhrbacteria bacterium CG10_big_fil_rev_8_21_14_0_10_48_11]|uniref:Uncharacterized protein n=1 Tax=Candidatus Uhrbacteria bacterium CG10_big_fil_rev_8_21_14_0_10_48_11 TaxID=1975037 RepID=A0A2M8LER6_9BACT|nr:MAG: hypothetical protein COV04_02135 [Candidatus Uhrbacteria bacterium CG10_big_fil_rev_8_21_14_0_10_48_11]
MKKQLIKRLAATGVAVAMMAPFIALAQSTSGTLSPDDLGLNDIKDNIGLGDANGDVRVVIARIVRVLLGFLGIVAVLIVLYGGFQWMTAAGNEERVSSARATLTAGLIGLIIILSAYAIASYIINTILETTTGVTAS